MPLITSSGASVSLILQNGFDTEFLKRIGVNKASHRKIIREAITQVKPGSWHHIHFLTILAKISRSHSSAQNLASAPFSSETTLKVPSLKESAFKTTSEASLKVPSPRDTSGKQISPRVPSPRSNTSPSVEKQAHKQVEGAAPTPVTVSVDSLPPATSDPANQTSLATSALPAECFVSTRMHFILKHTERWRSKGIKRPSRTFGG